MESDTESARVCVVLWEKEVERHCISAGPVCQRRQDDETGTPDETGATAEGAS